MDPGDATPPTPRWSGRSFGSWELFLDGETPGFTLGPTYLVSIFDYSVVPDTIPSVSFGATFPIGPSIAAASTALFVGSHTSAFPVGLEISSTTGETGISLHDKSPLIISMPLLDEPVHK